MKTVKVAKGHWSTHELTHSLEQPILMTVLPLDVGQPTALLEWW